MKNILLIILLLAPIMLSAKWEYVYKGNENFRTITTKNQYVFAITDSNKVIYSLNSGLKWDSLNINKKEYCWFETFSSDSLLFIHSYNQQNQDSMYYYKLNIKDKSIKKIFGDEIYKRYSLFEFDKKLHLLNESYGKLNVIDNNFNIQNTPNLNLGNISHIKSINSSNNIGFAISGYYPIEINGVYYVNYFNKLNNNIMFDFSRDSHDGSYKFVADTYTAGDSNWFIAAYDGYHYLDSLGMRLTEYKNMSNYALGYGFSFVDAKVGYCISTDSLGNKISYTKNKGRNWEYDEVPKDLKRISGIAAGKTYSYACGDGYILRTENITSIENEEIQPKNIFTLLETVVTNSIDLQFELSNNRLIQINIVNSSGAIVQSLKSESFDVGNNTKNIDISKLSQGTFFVQIFENGVISPNVIKFVKIN